MHLLKSLLSVASMAYLASAAMVQYSPGPGDGYIPPPAASSPAATAILSATPPYYGGGVAASSPAALVATTPTYGGGGIYPAPASSPAAEVLSTLTPVYGEGGIYGASSPAATEHVSTTPWASKKKCKPKSHWWSEGESFSIFSPVTTTDYISFSPATYSPVSLSVESPPPPPPTTDFSTATSTVDFTSTTLFTSTELSTSFFTTTSLSTEIVLTTQEAPAPLTPVAVGPGLTTDESSLYGYTALNRALVSCDAIIAGATDCGDDYVCQHNVARSVVANAFGIDIAPLAYSSDLQQLVDDHINDVIAAGCPGHVDTVYPISINGQPIGDQFGQNCDLFFGLTGGQIPKSVLDYLNECYNYNSLQGVLHFNNGVNFDDYGHYTQVIWGGTQYVACGMADCGGGKTEALCDYFPAGNYMAACGDGSGENDCIGITGTVDGMNVSY